MELVNLIGKGSKEWFNRKEGIWRRVWNQAFPKFCPPLWFISAEMMMTYQEDMLDEEMKKLEESNPVPEWLNDENVKAEDIVYKGDLKKKHI